MIQANDLRIGNKVYYSDQNENPEPTIIEIGLTDLILLVNKVKSVNYLPIPLTEKILMDCGFLVRSGEWCYATHKISTDFTINNRVDGNWRFTPIWCSDYVPIQHLHELQNLFYSLTKTELIINL